MYKALGKLWSEQLPSISKLAWRFFAKLGSCTERRSAWLGVQANGCLIRTLFCSSCDSSDMAFFTNSLVGIGSDGSQWLLSRDDELPSV